MKNKKIVVISVFSIIVIFLIANIYIIFYKSRVYNNTKVNDEKYMSNLAIMLETKYNSGEYKASESSRWPATGYLFNSERSYCENGGKLDWDDATWSLTFHNNVTDKCYIYFDVEPPDVVINVNNLPDTYGKKGVLTCNDGDITYNQQYNKVIINQVNTKYTNCTLNYEEQEDKVNFADYIMSLAGTTQGTGEVVKETVNKPDYNSGSSISESDYVSITMFTSTGYWQDSGTSVSGLFTYADNTWTSVPSLMTTDSYYHFKFNPSENGYYQMCYELSAGNGSNNIVIYINSQSLGNLTPSTSESKSGCLELGYVNTTDFIKISQHVYDSIPTFSFRFEKVESVQQNINAGTRYEGKDPNNYVWFNNEYWRIIGVLDEDSHGQNGMNLVKIIRNNVLDAVGWNNSGNVGWENSDLYKLLNDFYYNKKDAMDSKYCARDNTKAVCDYNNRGISLKYRNMIANVTWYLGGYFSTRKNIEGCYDNERRKNIKDNYSASTTGYIGLMYITDYGYSVLSNVCARTTFLSSYYLSSCASQSWLYGMGSEWTINTPYYIWYTGNLTNAGTSSIAYLFRPVLYLNDSVYKISGDGSYNNPYIIGM